MSVWRFGLCDLAGVNIGEVHNAYERNLSLPLNGLPTAKLRMRLDDPLAQEIADRNGDCLVKVYQGTTLRFIGEIMSVEEGGPVKESEGVSLTVTAAGPWWRLQKRPLGVPYPPGASPGLSPPGTGAYQGWADTPANTIIADIVNQTNTNWDTGIRLGTLDTLLNTSIGIESSISFKPVAEVVADMQAAKIAYPVTTPPAYVASDDMSDSNGTAISGKADDQGNTWTSSGVGPDWTTTSGSAGRTSSSSASGRLAISSAADHTNVLVGMDYYSNVNPFAGGLDYWVYARFAGYTLGSAVENTGTWIRAQVSFATDGSTYNGAVYLQKRTGGTITELGRYLYAGYPGLEDLTWYSIRLLVDDQGNYRVWNYPTALANVGGGPSPIIFGQDDALATGGTIAQGKFAWGDENVSAFSVARSFDNPFASIYTGPQSFDFEVAPQEPVADAVPYPGTMPVIGTLNVRTQIGTVKPEAIFEYGSGKRSVKKYSRVINREGMVTKAYSLPPSFPDSTDIAISTNQTAIDARGLLEEVIPTDVADAQLRQALADAHTRIRGVPRQIITFDPSDTAPQFGVDYSVGDFVIGRGQVNGSTRFNATFRIYRVEISVDDNGKADVIPTLVPE